MSVNLPPVPHQTGMTTVGGFLSPPWADWFNKLSSRVGGSVGQTGDFKSALSSSGYQQFPGGLTLQWGSTGSVSSGSTQSVNFPMSFSNSCLQVFSGIINNSAVSTANTGQWGTGNYSASGFDLYNRTNGAKTFNWFAVGF